MPTKRDLLIAQFPPSLQVKNKPEFGCHDADCEECHINLRVCWQMVVYGGFEGKDLGKRLE